MRKLFAISCLLLACTAHAQVDTGVRKQDFLKKEEQMRKNVLFEKSIGNEQMQIMKLFEQQSIRAKAITAEHALEGAMMAISPEPELENRTIKRLTGPSRYDSRIELRQFDITEEWEHRVVNNAASVGLVIKKENLYPLTDSLFQLNTGLTLAKRFNLCPGQAFAQQPVAGEGTAFIIEGGRFVTAGHVFTEPLDRYAIVFGFEILNKTGAYENRVPLVNIYYPKKIVEHDEELDITIVETDRMPNRPALALSKKGAQMLEEVYMIGYPSGLPIKASLNARVRSMDQRQYFYTSLDAFQGNSGSPVFSFRTHEVIGVLVSGELDYVWTGNCNVTTLCTIPYCKGEKVIRISEVVKPAGNQ